MASSLEVFLWSVISVLSWEQEGSVGVVKTEVIWVLQPSLRPLVTDVRKTGEWGFSLLISLARESWGGQLMNGETLSSQCSFCYSSQKLSGAMTFS